MDGSAFFNVVVESYFYGFELVKKRTLAAQYREVQLGRYVFLNSQIRMVMQAGQSH
ncbi:MAG: hypothetical protein R8K49_07630 [Mariprofundaceae bacterium]